MSEISIGYNTRTFNAYKRFSIEAFESEIREWHEKYLAAGTEETQLIAYTQLKRLERLKQIKQKMCDKEFLHDDK